MDCGANLSVRIEVNGIVFAFGRSYIDLCFAWLASTTSHVVACMLASKPQRGLLLATTCQQATTWLACRQQQAKLWLACLPRGVQELGFRRDSSATMSSFSGDETAPFFGFLGAAAALVFSCMGAAYGTAKSGVGVASMGVMRPEFMMKSIVPVVMAGVLGIYGLIIAVIISTGINPKAKSYYLFDGYAHLSSGLACGLAGLSAGMAIGIVGDAGVR
ncbi:hypothetical protein ZIOFF_074598 [Zingiber officinale]|uniref:V-type proton ATPase proteolipid subunit n=2 Tax=Zingiber officinale TaxID=94328 RepID=A0A8J5BUB3_ZINOF|nr:hypothetical protein ZIOFF_074598 [Zingiber officinale]